ncbi:MAG: carboxypeptidase regulatory-like domain-containing protein [Chitinophagaceae bacterium]|nr:carboxypeptidase regulatory-like domain-containing protein [Chitinophagaceae bacterium]
MKKLLLFIAIIVTTSLCFANGKEKKGNPIVSGNITDASTKKALAEVTLTAVNTTSKKEHIITNDANGNFEIHPLPAGNYKFNFEEENYTPSKKRISASSRKALLK